MHRLVKEHNVLVNRRLESDVNECVRRESRSFEGVLVGLKRGRRRASRERVGST